MVTLKNAGPRSLSLFGGSGCQTYARPVRIGLSAVQFAFNSESPSKKENEMAHRSLEEMISTVKSHPAIRSAGMLLCHNGFVRATSRSGENVAGLQVSADRKKIQEIREWALTQPGIIAVEIEALEGGFEVGDDLLYVVVAGDIRENVFAAMRATVERLKSEGVSKSEQVFT